MEFFLEALIYASLCLISIFLLFFFYFTSSFNYWKDKNIPYIKPSFPFGTLGDIVMGRKSLIDVTLEQYRKFDGERFYGIFHLNKPVLVLKDPSLIEKVLITDFAHFCNRVEGTFSDEDVIASLLGNMQGDTWRQLRHRMSGAFSTAKLRQMAGQICLCADRLVQRVEEYVSRDELLNGNCLGYTYFQETTASCAFGIEYDGDGLVEFCKRVKSTFLNTKIVHVLVIWYMYLPKCAPYLYYFPPVAKFVEYFRNLTSAAIQVRKVSGSKRNDFLQILIDLKDEDPMETDFKSSPDLKEIEDAFPVSKVKSRKLSSIEKKPYLSDAFISSQMFMFMGYGLELSAAGLTFLMYDLATHPEVQRRVQAELDAVLTNHGALTYDAVNQLTYLDMVLQECARLKPGPGFPFVTRVCETTYNVPDSDLVLDKGTLVLIPSFAVHQDPCNYLDPGLFDPERFLDNHYKPSPTYLPYGAGPRMCIALRLVVLQLKLAVAKVMQRFSVSLPPETEVSPPHFSPQFFPKMRDTVWLRFQKRSPSQRCTD